MPKASNPPKCKCGCGEPTDKYFDQKGVFKSYLRRKKGHGRGEIVNGKRKCGECKKWTPVENFGWGKGKNGLVMYSYCKPCHSQRASINRRARYGSIRNYWLIKRYGINEKDFIALVALQKGKCAICQTKKATMVDHCHETNRVRGVLCNRCNSAIGVLGDTIQSITRAVEYLKRSTNAKTILPLRTLQAEAIMATMTAGRDR